MIHTPIDTEKDKHPAEELVEQVAAHPWMERLARFGYFTKGLVYMVVGATAILADFGMREKTTDTHGALQTISEQPFGKFALGTVAFGLVGYVIWRLVQAIADADEKGRDLKGLSVRTGYALSGLAYAALASTAAKILIDVGDPDTGSRLQQDWTARMMAVPFGRLFIGLVGLGVIAFGIFQIYKGYKAKFRKRLKLFEMGRTKQVWTTWSGQIGYAARGIVFCIVGVFLIQAAWDYNPKEVKGLEGALQALARQSFGTWILGIVAAGLFAYGFYMLVEARYRRIAGS